jgi:hypothetical protein
MVIGAYQIHNVSQACAIMGNAVVALVVISAMDINALLPLYANQSSA